MKQRLLSEALYQVAALIIAVIVVHAAYVAVIRPNADLIQEQQSVLQQTDPNFVPERSVYIIMRDFEQETCIILLLWALSIIGMKTQQTLKERWRREKTLINVSNGLSECSAESAHYAPPETSLLG